MKIRSSAPIYLRKNIAYFPLLLIQLYLTFIIVFYMICPWNFETQNSFMTFSLLIVYQLSFALGYIIAIKGVKISQSEQSYMLDKKYVITIIIGASLIMNIIQLVRALGLPSFDFINIVERIVLGFRDPNSGYNAKTLSIGADVFLGKVGTIISILWSPIAYAAIPLSIMSFKKSNGTLKFVIILNVILYICQFVATGTNKGIFDLVIFLIAIKGIEYLKKTNLSYKQILNIKFILCTIFLLIPALLFFNHSIGSRDFGNNWSDGYLIGGKISLNGDSIIFKLFPKSFHGLIVLLASYLCQGIYGFSYNTTVNWTPLFGIGNSMFLVDQISELVAPINQYTYQYKVELAYGWSSREQWSSFYSWWANDVGIYGVITLMFIFGFFFAVVYKQSIITNNTLSKIIFCFLTIAVFYIPANNQMAIALEPLMTSYFLIALWLLQYFRIRFRMKYNLRNDD